jgi:hypothetical protein
MSRARIRELNDQFRSKPYLHGRLFVTAGVNELGDAFVAKAIGSVQRFAEFTDDNDPHGEHDFGGFVLEGRTLFWRIDYYDPQLRYSSEDPADPTKTIRVLTIMLAEEY